MFVCMLIELENHKILQAGCFWRWQIKEEGKLSSIDKDKLKDNFKDKSKDKFQDNFKDNLEYKFNDNF